MVLVAIPAGIGHKDSAFFAAQTIGNAMTTILACSFVPTICRETQNYFRSVGVNRPIATAHGGYTATDVAERFYAAHMGERPATKEVGDAWRMTASDLVLANAKNQPWGWASKYNLALIEHWRKIEPQSFFLFVYSSPAHALAMAVDIGAKLENEVYDLLDAWKFYHAEMLRTYNENRNVSLLLDVDSLIGDDTQGAKLFAERFGLPIDTGAFTPASFTRPTPVYDALSHALISKDESLSKLLSDLEAASDAPSRKKPFDMVKAAIAAIGQLPTSERPVEEMTVADHTDDDEDLAEMDEPRDLEADYNQATQEVLVLRRQLQRAREEILGMTENAAPSQQQDQSGAAPNNKSGNPDYYFDMRAAINGENWLPAGPEGRWAGPETVSTLKLPRLPKGKYRIVFGVLSAMAVDIFKDMKIAVNGAPLPVSHKNSNSRRAGLALLGKARGNQVTFPTTLEGTLTIDDRAASEGVTLRLTFPRTIAPKSQGAPRLKNSPFASAMFLCSQGTVTGDCRFHLIAAFESSACLHKAAYGVIVSSLSLTAIGNNGIHDRTNGLICYKILKLFRFIAAWGLFRRR